MPIISQLNYLKEIYKIQARALPVSVSALAQILAVSPPSVTQQLRALSKKHLVRWEPRGPIGLTPKGQRWAVDLIRKHRIIESFLVQHLAYNPLEAHREAENLEHFASHQFVDALSRICGNPKHDPHGDPIPSRRGKFPARHRLLPLADLAIGRRGTVAALSESDHRVLQSITDKKLAIGGTIKHGAKPGEYILDGRRLRLSATQVALVFLARSA